MLAVPMVAVSRPRYCTRSTRLYCSGVPLGAVASSIRLFCVLSHLNRSSLFASIVHHVARLVRVGVVRRTRVLFGIVAPLVWRVGSVQVVK